MLAATGISHAVLRPTVLFGEGDVLVNNIAWCVRRFPLFLMPGDGRYRVQPLHVADFASSLAAAAESRTDFTADAVGPETYTFRELVGTVACALGRRPMLLGAPWSLVRAATAVLGTWVGDVLLTTQEIEGLCGDLLASDAPPTGTQRLSEWLRANAANLGVHYASEVARHYR